MTVKNPLLRRATAALGAISIAVSSLLLLGSPAVAAVGPDQPGAPTAGTLTVNKYSGSPVGSGENPDPENLLDGVQFTVQQVGKLNAGNSCEPIDLAAAPDWDGLKGLFNSAPAAPSAPYCLISGSDVAQSTVNGTTVFNLDLGVYFVRETDPGQNNIVSKVPDFYVSIPTSEGSEGNGWNYNVVADPKNQILDEPTKTIDPTQAELTVGSDVTWNLNVPVPTLNNGEKFTEAIALDALDSRLRYVANSTVATVGGTPLVQGTHYNVTGNAVWTFTAAGRAVLDANMGQSITLNFDTTVLSVGNGAIPNDDYKSTFNGTTVPGEQVPYTYWGQLSILKTDNSKPNALNLAGAEFQVFNLTGVTCPAQAPSNGTVATGTSDTNGIVQWSHTSPASSPLGLWITNVDNGPADPAPSKDYCVYETVVPAGHTATPIDNPVTITPGESNVNAMTVVNAKTEGPDLPMTGAQGTILLTVGGLVIVAAGGGLILAARRRNNKQDA